MTIFTLETGNFNIEVFSKEKKIEITDKDGVCKVKGETLIVPEVYGDMIAPYLLSHFTIEYMNDQEGMFGHIKYSVLEDCFYKLTLANENGTK